MQSSQPDLNHRADFNYLLDMLIDRSGILRSNKSLTRAMLYYMYWNCDIGRDKRDQTV